MSNIVTAEQLRALSTDELAIKLREGRKNFSTFASKQLQVNLKTTVV